MSRTSKVVLAVVGVIAALVIVGFLLLAVIFSAFREHEPAVADHSVLVLKVGGPLPDHAVDDPVARMFGAQTNSLASLLTQLRKAKADKRVDAVLLDIDFVATGWAKADEIRDAVADFRTSGKPVYAYMEYGADKELYIASAADRVYVAPIGDLFINGLAAQAMFFRGSLDKLGVYPDFFQIGKYKNAPDSYTRKEMSEPHREVVNAVLDDHFNRYVSNLAAARKKSPEDIVALINRAPVSARDAEAAGLIDGALYREQVETELKKRIGYKEDEKLKTVTGSDYRRVSQESLGLNEGDRVAVIYASGIINSGQSDDGSFGGEQMAGSDTLVKAINDARDDKSVKAIVLRVDSPGGGSYPSDLIWQAVEKAKEKKPVVASMGDLAASGGYYVSMNANRIVAQPSTITGSIGVFAGKPVIKGFYDWIGVSTEYVLRGENAGMFRETEPFTDKERERFESLVKSFYYDDFLPKVAKGRGKDVEYIDSVAQGRVWTGAQAKERGLVDEFGGLDRAVEVAKELAGIPADKSVRRVIYPAPRTFFERFFDTEGAAEAKARREQQALLNSLPEDMRRAFRYARVFDRMKHGEVMAMLPFELTIE
ncbi:MAG TPA: signal peptide peptidase SppA [Pyrinomonadaceae bacterium]|nr:signal peptide peptidase SppA [Pyrinomonadaceae bacterium]